MFESQLQQVNVDQAKAVEFARELTNQMRFKVNATTCDEQISQYEEQYMQMEQMLQDYRN